jgi:hypothetical protein
VNQRIQDATGLSTLNNIVTAAKQTQQMKSAQPIGGDSLIFYQSDSGLSYDWSGTLPASGGPSTGTKILLVEVQAVTQKVLFADLIYDLYVGSSTNRYTVQDYLSALESHSTGFIMNRIPQPLDINNQNKARFGISIDGDTTTTCYTKFYAVANDQINITVTEKN